MDAEKKQKAPKKSWTQGLQTEFKKIIWPDRPTLVKQTVAVVAVTAVLGVIIAVIDSGVLQLLNLLINKDKVKRMSETNWYVVHTYSGYENKVKANIDKTIENRHLEDQILEVRVPMQDVVELKNGVQKAAQRKLFPGYVLIHMIMNDDTWYVVRNTRGVTGFVGPGSKPVPLTDEEMAPLGIKKEDIVVDFEVGDTVSVVSGAWADTVGVIQAINTPKQSVTINVELFGRETPVEIGFSDVKKM